MKGYFSKLAKQSGMLNAAKIGAVESHPSAENSPPHYEETVLAAPGNPQDEKRNFADLRETPSAEKPLKDAENPTAPPESGDFETPEKQISAAPEKVVFQAEALKTVATENQAEDKTSSANQQSTENDLTAIEQTVFKDAVSEESSQENSFTAKPPENVVSITAAEKDETVRAEAATVYFQKTSELIESGTASPLEIQRVLLREVQQWTSDAPQNQDVGAEAAEKIIEKRAEVKAIVAPFEKKAGAAPNEVEEIAVKAEKLREESFNLSIGSISITVEEPETKVQNETVKQSGAAATANQPEKRPFSPLSRYYL